MTSIIRNFDCTRQEHVLWLKKLHEAAENLTDGKLLKDVMEKNPFGIKDMNHLDAPEVHMILSTKYTGAVLSKKAWIP